MSCLLHREVTLCELAVNTWMRVLQSDYVSDMDWHPPRVVHTVQLEIAVSQEISHTA